MIDEVVVQLDDGLEDFLVRWARFLRESGYFEESFATRDESIKAFYALLSALKALALESHLPTSSKFHQTTLAHREYFLNAAHEQRMRGCSLATNLGFLKTMRLAVEDMVREMVLPDGAKLKIVSLIRQYFDVVESSIVADWESTDKELTVAALGEANRQLSHDKNVYKSIFDSTSNLVLITNDEGIIQTANSEAMLFFHKQTPIGQDCRQLLGLPDLSLIELLQRVTPDQSHEITIQVDSFSRVFNLQIKPLARVSISLPGVMLILSDITCVVDHRQLLEQRVSERTQALANSEKMLGAIFQSVGNGVLLIDNDLEIVKANQQASEIYGIPSEVLLGTHFCSLIVRDSCKKFEKICLNLLEGEMQKIEVACIYVDGKIFPADIVITRMDLDGQSFWPVIVRDISQQRALEDGLRAEKLQSEEMNVTLRNVLKSIESDRQETEQNLSHRIRTSLLPSLEKVRKEKNSEVRSSYLNMIREQLVSLTTGFEKELDGDLLKLSKTELKICRFIKSGLTGKEICEAMNLSFETIQTHRKNIRKKLGLSGRAANLHTFLANRNVELGGLDRD